MNYPNYLKTFKDCLISKNENVKIKLKVMYNFNYNG